MRKLLLLTAVLLSTQCFAQTTIDLNPITLTVGRTPQKASETGRNISVLDGKLFNQLPVHSIDELLKYIPGVEVQSRGPMGSQSDIVIRGGTFQQVLVLLDGLKVNDPITGHFSSYIPIAPYEIERIEVLRGPAAAMYGAEAVGGVINVITKTFNKYKKEKTQAATIGIAAGQYGLFNSNLGWHTTGEKINAAVGIVSNNANGQLLRGNNRGYFHNNTISGSVAFALKNNWQLALRSSYDSRDFAAQNFYTSFKSDTATEKVNTWWNQAQLKQQTKNYTQQFDVLYKKTSDHYAYNPAVAANNNKADYIVLQYLYGTKLNKQFTLNAGTQVDKRTITSNDRGNHTTNHAAIFASLLYSNKNLKIAPALRFDRDGNYGTALLPQLNVSYQVKNINFRTNAGRSIRGGDFTERYNNYNKALVFGGSVGNPNLSTENAWSYEAGADIVLNNNFKASVTAFYRNQHNVIDFVVTPYSAMPRKDNLSPTGTFALAQNIKNVNTSGIEFEMVYQKVFNKNSSLLLNTGITLLKSTSDGLASFYIISHAKTMVQSTVLYHVNKFNVAINMVFKDRNALAASGINATITKSYFLMNTKVGYNFYKNMNFYIACDNLTDITYSDLLGSKMPRRWSSAGIAINL